MHTSAALKILFSLQVKKIVPEFQGMHVSPRDFDNFYFNVSNGPFNFISIGHLNF